MTVQQWLVFRYSLSTLYVSVFLILTHSYFQITDHLDEEQLLNESINGDAGSIAGESAGVICKIESLDHEELDYEEDEEVFSFFYDSFFSFLCVFF